MLEKYTWPVRTHDTVECGVWLRPRSEIFPTPLQTRTADSQYTHTLHVPVSPQLSRENFLPVRTSCPSTIECVAPLTSGGTLTNFPTTNTPDSLCDYRLTVPLCCPEDSHSQKDQGTHPGRLAGRKGRKSG